MNKVSKILIVLFLAFLLGGCFGVYSVQAQDELILETTKKCDIRYSGDSCVAELKITNNTGEILDGETFLHINYQGECSGNELINFDGEGIESWYNNFSSVSGWNGGNLTFSGFEIIKDETQPELKVETVPNLCPGEYTFTLSVKGTFEEEEYTTPPVVIGVVIGGGGGGGHLVVCGDGIREWEEQCDDGNAISGDGCSSICKTEVGQVAGASTEQQGGGEEQGGGQQGSGTGEIAEATTGEPEEQGTEQGLEEEQGAGNEEVPGQEANAGEEPEQGPSLLAAIGNILSFGTGNAWLAVIIGLIILALLMLIVFRITRGAKRRNFEKNLKK